MPWALVEALALGVGLGALAGAWLRIRELDRQLEELERLVVHLLNEFAAVPDESRSNVRPLRRPDRE